MLQQIALSMIPNGVTAVFVPDVPIWDRISIRGTACEVWSHFIQVYSIDHSDQVAAALTSRHSRL
jgi:hypothetical protein